MSSVETGQMSAVETGQMSAAETGQMSAVETRQMYSIETGQRPFATEEICLASAGDDQHSSLSISIQNQQSAYYHGGCDSSRLDSSI